MYAPPHLNQFRNETGALWGPTIWPNGDSRVYTGNCWATTASMQIRYEMQGDFTHPRVPGAFQCTGHEAPTPPRVRYWSGQRGSGGKLTDMVRAALHWRVHLRARYSMSLGELRWRVEYLGQPITVSTDYQYIRDVWSCQPSFDGDHSILVRAIEMFDFEGKAGFGRVLAVKESDPLCETGRWIPWSQFAAAANAFTAGPGINACLPHTQEDIMALFDFNRGRVADVPKGTVLRIEPDGLPFATLGSAAVGIPVLGATNNGSFVALGFTRVGGKEVKRGLWVGRSELRNVRLVASGLDEDAIRADQKAKDAKAAAEATAKAVEAARVAEQRKADAIRAERDSARDAFRGLKQKVVERLTAEGKDADAFLADVADDAIPAPKK